VCVLLFIVHVCFLLFNDILFFSTTCRHTFTLMESSHVATAPENEETQYDHLSSGSSQRTPVMEVVMPRPTVLQQPSTLEKQVQMQMIG
jgi:hypothetical protein